jgi:hypothetical protein
VTSSPASVTAIGQIPYERAFSQASVMGLQAAIAALRGKSIPSAKAVPVHAMDAQSIEKAILFFKRNTAI